MRTTKSLLWAFAAVNLAGAAFAADPATPPPTRQIRLGVVDLSARLPGDFMSPEGRSRWDLKTVPLARTFVRSFSETADEIILQDASAGSELSRVAYKDDREAVEGAAAARRWLFPDHFPELLRPGSRTVLEFSEERDGRQESVRAEVAIVGIGWLDLPSGPREVVLQRALLSRDVGGGRGPVPERVMHRFIDPRAGVMAEIVRSTAASGGGAVTEAVVVERVLAGAATLKIYVEQLDTPAFSGISYGWDKGAGTTIASMTPQGYATMGDLIAANAWDFSANTSGAGEDVSTGVPVTAAETCNSTQCGYNPGGLFPNRILSREDLTPNGGTLSKTNAVTERETRVSDVTVWLRGGSQFEGSNAAAPNGESRFCYVNDDGVARTPVPIWRFPNQDPLGWFMQPGDAAWVGGPFNCEQNIFNAVCGVGGIVPKLWTKGCTGTVGTHAGTQSGQVLKGGVVTLPSGHTFNALLVKTVADFCVYIGSSCASFLKADEVRTFVYLWQVPVIGTVARLTSVQNAADGTSFTSVAGTDFIFGLFPPLSMTVNGTTDTTASITWDPGRDTHRIGGYKVYWGTTSGSGGPYAFDSTRNPGQVAIAGTTATISGLSPGTTYYVTVTSLSAYRDPSTGVTTTYESLLYPTQVSGDPAFVYPIEVQATTTGGTCIPTTEVTNLTLQTATGGAITFCWDPVSDPCLQGYEILSAPSPTAAGNFSVLADTGPGACFTGSAPFGYFLVVARGSGGTGPWGAYGR